MSNNENPTFTVANPIPLFSVDMIKELDEFYPKETPLPGSKSPDELWFDNGKRWLIDQLLERLEGTDIAQQKGDITVNV